jgi:hypothetical protein
MDDDRGVVWAAVAEVADAVEAELDALVASIEDRILARLQQVNGGPPAELRDALRRGVSAATRDALARLRFQAELPQELPPGLVELARLFADSRWELAGLADAALAGQEVFWDRFQVVAEETLANTAACWEVVKAARMRLTGNPARLTGMFRDACERESARGPGVDEDARLRAVLRALGGEWVDPADLGYDLASHHIALVADATPSLDAAARRTQRQLLSVQAPDGDVWGWLGGSTRLSDEDLDMLASDDSSGGSLALGEPAEGIVGFAISHHQALEARAVAVAVNQPTVRFGDFRLVIAVLRDGDLAKGFIERELGDLDRPGERMHELRETLRAYLEHSQSVSVTAALRQRDRKTIERQLRSAEQLIHHHVSDRSDEVLIALRVAEILRHGD